MKKTFVALSLAAFAIPASAQTVSFDVEYRDLDLTSSHGQQTLEHRIDAAARKACNYSSQQTGSRLRGADTKRCYEEAKASATKKFAAVVEQRANGG
jgi:UrcA family protein